MEYAEALRAQAEVTELRAAGRVANVLLLLEHPPVLTLGRNANSANILASRQRLAERGVTVHEINRGGDVTYHGPGQLVGYPIFDLRSLKTDEGKRLGPVDFVRRMEEALIRLCGAYGLAAGRITGLTGVWCKPAAGGAERKIAAIGIHVARGITSHGFAFNVTTDLRDFQMIVPCGIADHGVTSLEVELREHGLPHDTLTLEAAANHASRLFGQVFDEQILALDSMEALRRLADAAAQDTPLHYPPELEQRRGAGEPPERC